MWPPSGRGSVPARGRDSEPLSGGFAEAFSALRRTKQGSRRSPAKRVRWEEEKLRNDRVFAVFGGNEGYEACADEKQEKGIGAFLRRCHLQHPAVQAATRDCGVVKKALFSKAPEPFDAKFGKNPRKVPCHKALRRRCNKYGNDFNCRILRTNID